MGVNSTTILSDAPATGTWGSSDVFVGIAGTLTGIIQGISAGTVVITYTLPTGCFITRTETVDPLPASIGGAINVCVGLTTALTDIPAGGTWTSGNTVIATIGSASGVANGLVAGTSVISYIAPVTGCVNIATLVVNPLPAAISGATHLCATTTTILSDAPATGTWSSGNVAVALAGSSTGIISAIAAGTAVITYTLPTGCIATRTETVDALPAPIASTMNVCIGSTTTLSDATPGGTWTSANTAIAIIGSSSGIASGIASGSSIISYTAAGTGCVITATLVVNPPPSAISGTFQLCAGATTIVSDIPATGSWSSSNTTVMTAGTFTGIINGISAGTAVITYTLPTGCIATQVATINPLPAVISGAPDVCFGFTTTLSDATGGGSWISSNTSVATIGSSSGLVSGLVVGSTVISYIAPITGCVRTVNFVVNSLPSAISGATFLCAASTTILSDFPATGSWSSSNTSVATAGTFTGIVTGVAAGTVTITYALPTGCFATMTETINPLPFAGYINGTPTVCVGATITITDTIAGGVWSISNAFADISSAGVVTGAGAGRDTVLYTYTNSCGTNVAHFDLTVNPLPFAGVITGRDTLCTGDTVNLYSTVTGGSWYASNMNGIVASEGIVTALAPGLDTISYVVFNSCGSDTARYVVYFRTPAVCAAQVNSGVNIVEEEMMVYPNPNNGIFTIELSQPYTSGELSITDVLGRVIETMPIAAQRTRVTALDLNNIAAGNYFIKVNVDGRIYRKKITVVK